MLQIRVAREEGYAYSLRSKVQGRHALFCFADFRHVPIGPRSYFSDVRVLWYVYSYFLDGEFGAKLISLVGAHNLVAVPSRIDVDTALIMSAAALPRDSFQIITNDRFRQHWRLIHWIADQFSIDAGWMHSHIIRFKPNGDAFVPVGPTKMILKRALCVSLVLPPKMLINDKVFVLDGENVLREGCLGSFGAMNWALLKSAVEQFQKEGSCKGLSELSSYFVLLLNEGRDTADRSSGHGPALVKMFDGQQRALRWRKRGQTVSEALNTIAASSRHDACVYVVSNRTGGFWRCRRSSVSCDQDPWHLSEDRVVRFISQAGLFVPVGVMEQKLTLAARSEDAVIAAGVQRKGVNKRGFQPCQDAVDQKRPRQDGHF